MIARFVLAALLLCCWLVPALATPKRLIILRHGEKAGSWRLCGVGQARADALAASYLGRNAANSLFAAGEEPAAILAITRSCRRDLGSAGHPVLRAAAEKR